MTAVVVIALLRSLMLPFLLLLSTCLWSVGEVKRNVDACRER